MAIIPMDLAIFPNVFQLLFVCILDDIIQENSTLIF